ncbi:Olfactory receptor 7G1 [Sciurus carolinensis]|uniref:Olfactory receptor 7G1 n=1 Tax=Sciurus carolinensis TaxID=30640 RepID=A0AA41MYK5_SCICA|nr:Olfactory receptor 7G1 [Sciurus carolinensis]
MYLVTILGNLVIILAISSDSHLHMPKYFLPCSLSVNDICFSKSTVPMMLVNILRQDQITNYTGCLCQQVFKLSCSDTFINNLLVYLVGALFAVFPLSGIIFPYIHIVSSVLRIPSSGGKHKAFSTCGSHLSVFSLFYRTGLWAYISSAVTDSSRDSAATSVMYSVVPQMLNPFNYSLRNRDMKVTVRMLMGRTPSVL